MLNQIMHHIRNYFKTDKAFDGEIKIEEGTISLDFALEGAYMLIEGSTFNNGVYIYPFKDLKDETFTGRITMMAIPKEFIDLCDEIKAYTESKPVDGLAIEAFGGYSYSRATTSNGTLADWKDVFRSRLNTWRKI